MKETTTPQSCDSHVLSHDALQARAHCAVSAAREAGVLLRDMQHTPSARILSRTSHDVKMSADLASEKVLFSAVRGAYPDDGILSEESGDSGEARPGMWIIDPLDGTVNYAHGHPHYCVTLAWAWQGVPYVGVTYDACRDELFLAIRGYGARCNDMPIQCADTTQLSHAMIAAGFGNMPPEDGAFRTFYALGTHVQKMRISGSAALDLAYVAAGRYDGYVEASVYAWDIAAGCLLVEEAGGRAYVWKTPAPHSRRCIVTCAGLADAALAHLSSSPDDCARTCLDDIAD